MVKYICYFVFTFDHEQNIWRVYSHLSNKRGGWNKRGGGAKIAKIAKLKYEEGGNGFR